MTADNVLIKSICHENYVDMCTYDDGDIIDVIAGMSDDDNINDVYDDLDIDYVDYNDIDLYSDNQ